MTRRRLPGPTIPTVPSSKDVFVVSLKVTDEPLLARLGRLRALQKVVGYLRYIRRDGTMITTTAHYPRRTFDGASRSVFVWPVLAASAPAHKEQDCETHRPNRKSEHPNQRH